MIRVLWILGISLLASFGLTQTLTEGTEILITDPSSEVILGYGMVSGERLEIQLTFDARDVVLLFIQPDGSFSTQTGMIDNNGRLNLANAQGEISELSELLEAQSLGLELSYTDADSFEGDQEPDDEVLGPPVTNGKPDDTPGLGREGAPGQGGENPGQRDDNPGRGSGSDDNPGRGGGNDDNPGQGSGNDNPGQGSGDDNPGRGGGNDDNPGRGGGSDDDPGQGRPPGRGN